MIQNYPAAVDSTSIVKNLLSECLLEFPAGGRLSYLAKILDIMRRDSDAFYHEDPIIKIRRCQERSRFYATEFLNEFGKGNCDEDKVRDLASKTVAYITLLKVAQMARDN